MQFVKRIFLFLLTNILVMLTIGVVVALLMAFFPQLKDFGYSNIMVLSAVWGFGGAITSLLLSKVMAKWMSGVQVIDPATATGDERWLVQTVARLAEKAGIDMPEVGIWESPEVNAFCTGPTKNSSLVAVSTGILARMSKEELEGVLGHEISHAANGDMVTMTLVQGVVNSFVIFFSFVLSRLILRRGEDDRGGGFGEYMLRNLLQMVLSLVAFVAVIAPFSRWREFRADRGGAQLTGKHKMIAALEALADSHRLPQPAGDPALATMKIDSGAVQAMFSTHPPLAERIAALRAS
jgi:heat shock protein HtpX